jgi:hypothetical protein
MLVRVLLDNIGAELSFLTDVGVCTLCRVLLLDNVDGEEEVVVKAAESVE